jgi:hypothetical protein
MPKLAVLWAMVWREFISHPDHVTLFEEWRGGGPPRQPRSVAGRAAGVNLIGRRQATHRRSGSAAGERS